VGKVNALMDADAKLTGLKNLQGAVWKEGYETGVLRSHVFPDVLPNLRCWSAKGICTRIYSSGSIAAQKLLYAHTEAGDLTPLIDGYFDTTVGHKREESSYAAIVIDVALPAGEILFLSDVPEELDAARQAGLLTGLVERPGNKPVEVTDHPRIRTFAEVQVA
jgi:enolase-phosphatase E1